MDCSCAFIFPLIVIMASAVILNVVSLVVVAPKAEPAEAGFLSGRSDPPTGRFGRSRLRRRGKSRRGFRYSGTDAAMTSRRELESNVIKLF